MVSKVTKLKVKLKEYSKNQVQPKIEQSTADYSQKPGVIQTCKQRDKAKIIHNNQGKKSMAQNLPV